jgi:hypothetical protein
MTKYYLRLALFFTASGETAPARITAIATLANSCLIELRDLTPCRLRRTSVSELLDNQRFLTSRRVALAPLTD